MNSPFFSSVTYAARKFAVMALLIGAEIAFAQPSRIVGNINTSQWTSLPGNVHVNARPEYDQGKAPDSLQVQSVTLELGPSASQQTALNQLLLDQQNPRSSSYHRWLTPEEYADRFGVSKSDLAKIGDWARSQGLKVTGTARARNAVTLSGSAAQIDSAFHTEIHLYRVNGETHYANASSPSVPAAMSKVVAAIRGLHDFRMKPNIQKVVALGGPTHETPAYTSSSSGDHYLAPGDFATIFNLTPLYNSGIDGSGQKIVIVGQSQIDTSHLSTFTSYFGMNSVALQTVLVPDKQSPGYSVIDAQESDLDLQWSAAVARGASLIFVYSYDVFDAVQYAIDQNLAPVISMSYGECEESDTRSDATSIRTWAKQANAQGITWVAASGDSGAAGCYESSGGPFGPASSSMALAVELPASVPEVTAVGGTTFSEGSGSYWNNTNSSTKSSAKSYIPEVTWNDSAAGSSPAASGGGASQFFSKPSWQTGTGVPNDGARDVPDVAFPASADHDGYLVYTSSGLGDQWSVIGGTSAGAPTFSGVLALLNQYQVSNGYQSSSGLGNINTSLYPLASSPSSAFHDITSGNNKVETCVDPLCFKTSWSDGYSAGTGYDQTTGLGSVNGYTFITAWPTNKLSPTTSLTATPDTVTTAGTTVLTATVENPHGGTPGGTVAFSVGSTTLGTASLSGSSGTASATLSISASATGLSPGSNTITAVYSGDNTNNAATATTVLNVVGKPSITGLVDSASYRQAYAPGMALSIFGSNLALTTDAAPSVPLPTSLDNVYVTINNVAAPLYYISPSQLNVQIPYETPSSGEVTVVVSNNGQAASATIAMSAAAPGIYTDSSGYITPTSKASAGQTLVMYVNGAGALDPAVATGSTPASGATPVPKGATLVTVAGIPASTTYVGEPSWSVGVLQINFTVPSGAGTGTLPVVVSVEGRASKPADLTVSQ
jgi:uncharacterized protein (TIGR03437 family)